MLEITIPRTEMFDDKASKYVYVESETLTLEHSLIAMSKWEAKWGVPFFGRGQKTKEQIVDYVRCMTVNKVKNPMVYTCLSTSDYSKILEYIDSKQSATWFPEEQKGGPRETITSELIYYWMIACNIPFECQKWHINRLLTLVRVCQLKQQDPKKMSQNDMLRQRDKLNAERKARLHTKG